MSDFLVSTQALKRFLIDCTETKPLKQFVTFTINGNKLNINGYSTTVLIGGSSQSFKFDLNVYQINALIKLLGVLQDQPITITNEGQSSIILNNISI